MNDFLASRNPGEDTPIRILHVDDDPARLRLSDPLLSEHIPEIVVHTETAPTDAIERLDAITVDCIVSDFDMGSMDGLEFLEVVRERSPELPFILFTGKGSEEIASEAISAGVTDYLQKGGPDRYAVLANSIENVVNRYRAERETEAYQRHMNAVYDRVTDAFFALDTEWRFTFLNARGEELLDRPEAELLGNVVWEEFPESVNSTFEAEYREAMAEQEPTTFEAYFEPLETLFEVHAYPSTEGLSVYFRDVTDETRIREEHRRERELLERVFETSPVGIIILDTDGGIERANERVVEMLGLPEKEITERSYDSREWTVTDDDGAPIWENGHPLTTVFEDGTTIRGVRTRYRTPDGEWRHFSVNGAPVYAENGDVERIVFIIEDVSDPEIDGER
jgi:PAS domain S-box-containing protein